jgi:predicted amidohydrolase YtcJ
VTLILRNVRPLGGPLIDVAMKDGKIATLGSRLPDKGQDIDGGGKALLPGLADHHIHLFATAAKRDSVDLTGLTSRTQQGAYLTKAAALRPIGSWIRAIGFDETVAGLPSLAELDEWLPRHLLRVQDRTGALWMLNSAAIKALGAPPFPDCVECDGLGTPTGRIWRGDHWLRERLPSSVPSLTGLGRDLARFGVTCVTDAGANNGPEEASLLAAAGLPQHMTVMGKEDIPPTSTYTVGAVKLMLDDRNLPEIGALAERIKRARGTGRSVAAHCVTHGELVTYLAALDEAGGAVAGDRIEHGGMISPELIPKLALDRLIVVTQPAFIHDRGDRYAATIEPRDLPDLYRLRSLIDGGVTVIGGSDAPYGSLDPWAAMRAARDRRSAKGIAIGIEEAISADSALKLYLGGVMKLGADADFCLLDCSWDDALADLSADHVAATIINGHIV